MNYDVVDNDAYGLINGLNVKCSIFEKFCDGNYDDYCKLETHTYMNTDFKFNDKFIDNCLVCEQKDYTHDTVVFNTFIFCQLFNEFNARHLFDEKFMLSGIITNIAFMGVIFTSIGFQIFLIYIGGDFVKTSPLSAENFLICIGFGSISILVGFLSRFIPIKENPNTFFNSENNEILNYKNRETLSSSSAAQKKMVIM